MEAYDYYNADSGDIDVDFEGSYNTEGNLGLGMDVKLEQPDMLTGIQALPSTQLQGMTENFSMPKGIPSLMDDMATPSLGGGIDIDTTLPELDPLLMNPASGINTTPSYETTLRYIDPTNYF